MTTQAEHAQRFAELIHTQLVPYLTELADAELVTHAIPFDSDFLHGLMSQYDNASFVEIGCLDELDTEDLLIPELRDKIVQRAARFLAKHIMTVWLTTVEHCAKKRLLLSDFGPAMLPAGCEDRFYEDYEKQVGFGEMMEEMGAEVEIDEDLLGEPLIRDIAFTKEQLLELMRRVRAALPDGQRIPECALAWLRHAGILRPD